MKSTIYEKILVGFPFLQDGTIMNQEDKRMKRKLSMFCALILVVCMIPFSVGGCSGKSGKTSGTGGTGNTGGATSTVSTGSSNGQKHVTIGFYWNSQADPDSQAFIKNSIIEGFEKQNPNITVQLTLNNDPQTLEKQQLAAGAGPDMVYADGPTTTQLFATAGYLLPLDDYAAQYNWKSRFATWALKTCTQNGKLVGLPDGIDELVVYYNEDMFKQNGWKVPTNFKELESLCDAIKAKNITPFSFGVSDFKTANEWWISEALNLSLGNKEFQDVLTGKEAWNSPAMTKAISTLVDFWQKGYIYPNSAAITQDDYLNMFATGKAAMSMTGEWAASSILAAKPNFQWSTFAMPSWTDGVDSSLPVAIGASWGINKKSKNADAVAKFLDWYFSDQIVSGWVNHGTFEPMSSFNISKVSGADKHTVDLYNIYLQASKKNATGYCAWTYWPPDVETYAWNNIESLYMKQMSLSDYMNNLQANYTKDKTKNMIYDYFD